MPCLSTIVVRFLRLLGSNDLPKTGGRPEIIVEAPRPIVVGSPRPIIVGAPRPNVIVEQPRQVIGGLGGLVAGLGSALGSILTTDTDAPQADIPAQ